MKEAANLDDASDHVLFELLKARDADAWTLVYRDVVLAETRSLRSGEAARKWGVCAEDLMGMLYEDMIGRGKIALYRDDGGSVIGWLRRYVHGYVFRENPERRREVSLGDVASCRCDDDSSDAEDFFEKIAWEASESAGGTSLQGEDLALRRQEEWDLVQKCFGDLWTKSPLKAYVHLLKLRSNLSSKEIKDMLGVSSEANVDQLFSRAVREMQEARREREN